MATTYMLSPEEEARRKKAEEAALKRQQEEAKKAQEAAENAAANAAPPPAAAATSVPAAPEKATNPVEAKPKQEFPDVSAYGLPSVSKEDRLTAEYKKAVRGSVWDTEFDVVGHNYVAERYREEWTDDIERRNYASAMVAHSVGAGNDGTLGKGNTINVNRSSFKDAKQMVLFSTTMNDAKNQRQLIFDYAKDIGVDPYALEAEAEKWMKNTYNRPLYKVPQTDAGKVEAANKVLGGIGLTNIAGEALDIANSTPQQVIQAMRMNPDPDVHDEAYKAIQILQKTPGSQWYGMELQKSDLGFLDSADLTKADYDAYSDDLASRFVFADGENEQNMAAYEEAYRDINATYADNPRMRKIMLSLLNKTFEQRNTGISAPSDEAFGEYLAKKDEAAAANEPVQEEKKGFWANLLGKKDKDDTLDKIIEQDNANQQKVMDGMVTVDEEGNATYRGIGGGVSLGNVYAEPAAEEAPEVQGPQMPTASASGSNNLASAVNANDIASLSFREQTNALKSGKITPAQLEKALGVQKYASLDTAYSGVNLNSGEKNLSAVGEMIAADQPSVLKDEEATLPYDPNMTPGQALAAYRQGKRPDDRNMALISDIVGDEQSRKFMNACLRGYSVSDIYGGDTGSYGSGTVSNMNVYGNNLSLAMNTVGNSALNPELQADGMRLLNGLRIEMDKIISDPHSGFIVPSGKNQYDALIEMFPDKFIGPIEQVKNLYSEQLKAEEEIKIETLEDDKKTAELYRKSISEGNGTSEMAAWLAVHADEVDEGTDYFDAMSEVLTDPAYSKRVQNFMVGGSFWDDESYWGEEGKGAAAVEMRTLKAFGNDASGAFQSMLSTTMSTVLMDLEIDAKQMNISVDDYLTKYGFDSDSAIADLAYNKMIHAGHVVNSDPELQKSLETIRIGAGNAAWLGVKHGAISTLEGVYEGVQHIAEDPGHEERRFDLHRDMYSKFGENCTYKMREAMFEFANSGALSEESKAEFLYELEHNADIFDTAATYMNHTGFLSFIDGLTNEAQKDIETIEVIADRLDPRDRAYFNTASGLSRVGTTSLLAIPASLASPLIGATGAKVLTAGLQAFPSWSDTKEYYRTQKGAGKETSGLMSGAQFIFEAAINYYGASTIVDRLLGGTDFHGGMQRMMVANAGTFAQNVATAVRYAGPSILRESVEEGFEEGGEEIGSIGLEFMYDYVNAEIKASANGQGPSLTRGFEILCDLIEEKDAGKIGKDVLSAMGGGAFMGGIIRLGTLAFGSGGAFRAAHKANKFSSLKMSAKMARGDIPMNEENIGKFMLAFKSDLESPEFVNYMNGISQTANDTKLVGVALTSDFIGPVRKEAAALAEQTEIYKDNATAARSAADKSQSLYMDVRDQVAAGNVNLKSEMDAARERWAKDETAYNEAVNAYEKSGKAAANKVTEMLGMARVEARKMMAEDIGRNLTLLEENRLALAQEIARQADEAEAETAATEEAIEAEAETIDTMTDDELDAEIAKIVEAENAVEAAPAENPVIEEVAPVEAVSADEDSLVEETPATEAAPVEEAPVAESVPVEEATKQKESSVLNATARKEAIVRNQRNQFRNLTDRMERAKAIGDDAAYNDLEESRVAVQARLEALGVTLDQETNAPEPTTETPAAKPVGGKAVASKATTPVSPEPSTTSPAAKPSNKAAERKAARIEEARDIATGKTKEQRDAEKATEQAKANVEAMDVETFIERNYKDAPEKEKEGIREAWKRLRDKTPLKITGDIVEFASRVEKKFGVKIEFVDSLDGISRGEITGNRVKVAKDATTGDVVRSVIIHELTHKAEGSGKLYDRLSKTILDMKYGGDQNAMNEDIKQKVTDYSAYYKVQNRTDAFTDAEARQEIVADYLGDIVNGNQAMIERLVRDDYTLAQKIRNIIHDVIDKFTGVKDPQIEQMKKAVRMLDKAIRTADKSGVVDTRTRNQVNPGSWYDYSKPFADQVQDWIDGKIPKGDSLLVGGTPKVLLDIGFSKLPMTINQTHVDYAVNGTKEDHKMSMEMLSHLPELLADPIAIIESASRPNDSVVVLVDATINGKQTIAPITVQTSSEMNGVQIDANHLASSYGKRDNAIRMFENAVKSENRGDVAVYYLDKKRASLLISDPGLQLPNVSNPGGFVNSITDSRSPVKANLLEQTQTRQFKKWFEKSKVVDDEGNPLVVYHGSDSDFDTFDMSRGRANMDIQGAFFSPYEEDAGGYGANTKAFYLSIKNPASESVAYKALNRFKGQNNAGVKARQYLQSLGYDGVYNGYDEYIAFSPEQIKSATDNVGLFDPKNPNTKYSLPSQNALEAQILAWQKAHQEEIDAAAEGNGVSQQPDRINANPFIPEAAKRVIDESPIFRSYKTDSNEAQFNRAMDSVRRNGYQEEVERLLDADYFGTDDSVEAGALAIAAFESGDGATALSLMAKNELAVREAARTLQATQAFAKMSPTHVMAQIGGEMEVKLTDMEKEYGAMADEVKRIARESDVKLKDLRGGDELKRMNEQGVVTLERANNKWHVPINEKQQKLIDLYGLNNVSRPGLNYNRATIKQRMLEAILSTPEPDADTGNGHTLTERLEWMKKGKPVATMADLRYIADQIAQYTKLSAVDKNSREAKIALARALEAYGNITPLTKYQKLRSQRFVNMLLSVPSALRNVIGNAAMNAVNTGTHDTFGIMVDAAAGFFTGKRTQAMINMKERADGWHAFVEETKNTFRDYFVDKVDTSSVEKGNNKFDQNTRGRSFEHALPEFARNVEGYLMSVGDRNFWKKAYFNSLAEQQRVAQKNGVEMDWDTAVEQAKADADYATFNEDNAVRNLLSSARQIPGLGFVMDMIMPFTGVPTNITKRMVEYSPAGLAWSFGKALVETKMMGKNFDQKSFVDGVSRGLSGTLLFAIGLGMKELGWIDLGTGEEDDEKIYNLRSAMGDQYSPFIRIGNETISLAAFAPSISPVIMGAMAYESFQNDDDLLTALKNASVAAGDMIFDASYMSGLSDLFDQNGSFFENAANTLAKNTISQNMPYNALLGQIANGLDPYVRDTKDKNFIMQALKSGAINKVPIVREWMLNPKYDIAGNPIESKGGANDVLSTARNLVDPLTTTVANDDPVFKELERLSETTGSSSHIPTFLIKNSGKQTILAAIADEWNVNMDRSAGENNLVLSADERNHYNQMYGDLAFNGTGGKNYKTVGKGVKGSFTGINDYMNSAEYKYDTDEERAKKISDINKKAKLLTQSQIVIDKGYATYY